MNSVRQETQSSILIADDSPDNLEMMSFILRQAGYQVTTACDGREALEIVRRQSPDLIISDVSMPVMDGIELCRRTRADEKLQLVPILLVTGLRKDTESVSEGLQAGADDYLEAPYEPTRLIAKVRRLLVRHDSEKALEASQQQLQFVTDAAPVYIAHCDTQSRYRFVNKRYAERLKARPEDLVGKRITDVLGAEAYRSIEPYVDVVLNGRPVEFETVVPYEQLGKRHMRCAYVPEFDAGGKVKGFVAVISDVTERKRAEEALRESDTRLRLITSQVPAFLWVTDEHLRVTYSTGAGHRRTGTTPAQFIGMTIYEINQTDDESDVNVAAHLHALRDESSKYEVEWMGKTLETYVKALRDGDGNIIGTIGLSIDITEHKAVEESLRESRELFRSAFDHAAIGMALVSTAGQFLQVNRSLCEIIGYSEQELLATTFQAITYQDDLAADRRHVERMLAGDIHSYQLEKRYLHKLGHLVWGLLSVSLVRDAQGSPQYFVAQVQDVTERKLAEEKLRQRERQLSEAQRLAHIGSWDRDLKTNTITWSDEHFLMFGYRPQEFLPSYDIFLEHVHPEDRGWVSKRSEETLRTHSPFSYYVRIIRSDGEVLTIHSRGAVECDDRGNPSRMYGTTQDVTEMVRAEERLRSMNEKLQALSARLESAREEESIHIARELHDELGGTLTGLQWDLQSVSQRLKNIDMGAGDRAHVQGKIEGMGQLIDSSLETVRRISSELRPLILDDLGLKAAVEWRAGQFQAQTGITAVCHSQTEAEDLGRSQALAVYRILQEALTNVLRHAQATRVDLFMFSNDVELILEIRDNGRGISEEENNIAGSLGLLGMHERAQLVGGELSITGTAGKGTTVTVRVPLDRATGEV